MTKREAIEKAINALEQTRSDDLTLARMAFQKYSKNDLNKAYGNSGKTPNQILDEYEKRNLDINKAIGILQSM